MGCCTGRWSIWRRSRRATACGGSTRCPGRRWPRSCRPMASACGRASPSTASRTPSSAPSTRSRSWTARAGSSRRSGSPSCKAITRGATAAEPGKRYAGLLDVAGEEEEGSGPEAFDNASRRDSTALTIVEVETGGRELPLYRVVDRMAWTGTKHTALHDAARRPGAQRLEALGAGGGCHRGRRRPGLVPGRSVRDGDRGG